jgi:hypothetical protein
MHFDNFIIGKKKWTVEERRGESWQKKAIAAYQSYIEVSKKWLLLPKHRG